jgi:hypothetical protein
MERASSGEEHGGEGTVRRDRGQVTVTGRGRVQATAVERDRGQV